MSTNPTDEWELWWDARIVALENALGKADDLVGHASIPFDVGPKLGGAADILYFRNHVSGVVAVTAELIGRDDQVESVLGNYELMICDREDVEWGASLISRLAHYTLAAALNPGETMGIASAVPEGSTVAALLFSEYARFEVRGQSSGLLLCVGITADELDACRAGKRAGVEAALKTGGVYPYTDLMRPSVLTAKRKRTSAQARKSSVRRR